MYHYNDFEAWREYRSDLLREAEERRLARQLRVSRPGLAHGIRKSLLGFFAERPQRKMAGC